MGSPVVTREYTPRACRNSRKRMRLPPRHEMRPDSLALHAEQLRFPNQTHKEPRFFWLNSRKSPTTLSQDEKNTDGPTSQYNPSDNECSIVILHFGKTSSHAFINIKANVLLYTLIPSALVVSKNSILQSLSILVDKSFNLLSIFPNVIIPLLDWSLGWTGWISLQS